MSIANIRKYYNVPAKVGGRVEYTVDRGKVLAGKIVSTVRYYLRVRLDCNGRVIILHPTWEIRYLDAANAKVSGRPHHETEKER